MISILNDFTEFPGLRYCNLSEYSGELFYHQTLNAAFKGAFEKGEKLSVSLDGTAGYASSFLDEAFGNLVYDFTLSNIKKYLEIISVDEPHWKKMLEEETFKEWEERRKQGQSPRVTLLHNAWYRLAGNEIEEKVWEKPA